MQGIEKSIVDYARRGDRKGGLRAADVLIVACFVGAVMAGTIAFVQAQHRPLTRARIQYEVARVTAQATRPSYSPPPLAGRSFEDVSPWRFASTYVGILLTILGILILIVRVRRAGVATR
ncbi:MAG TPA: hypothetical protein VH475_00315 [Tepidisphaeraceae bacterium]